MIFTIDRELNVAYMRFAEVMEPVTSYRIGDDIVVDVDANGKVYGIEFLNANEQLKPISMEATTK